MLFSCCLVSNARSINVIPQPASVEVYEGECPIATYRLDTTLQEVEEKEEEVVLDETYLKASDFVWNPEKKPLEIQGVGTALITDVDGMPGYIDVIFTSVSQGFYMTNSTYTPGVASLRRLLISPSKICSAGLDGEQIVRPRKRR